MKRIVAMLALLLGMLAARSAAAQVVTPTPTPTPFPPIISDILTPIIGNAIGPYQPERYVMRDFLNLDRFVFSSGDGITSIPLNQLRWSYEIPGTPHYLINGVDPIDRRVVDPVNPPLAQTINKTIGSKNGVSEADLDASPNTITIRNQRLAPLGGTPVTPVVVGYVDIQAVTFWLSDSNNATSQTIFFYTNTTPGAPHRLSAPYKDWTLLNKETFSSKSWPFDDGPHGSVTTHTWPADNKGLCLEVPLTGNNWASVASPLPFFTLTANTLYRFRVVMNCSQAAPGHTPLWDLIVDNYDPKTRKGLNLFGMDALIMDNVGGANAVISSDSGTELLFYWTPAAVSTPQFQALYSGTTYAAGKDVRLRFRVLDVDDNKALLNNQKSGAICLKSIQVESIPLYKVTPYQALVDITSFKRNTDLTSPSLNNTEVQAYNNPSVLFKDGTVTLTPAGAGTAAELISLTPAADTDGAGGANPVYTPPYGNMADEWPIPWMTGYIYELTAQLSAPTATDEAHPFDVIMMGIDTPTNEANCESYISSVKGIASPHQGAPQTYRMFYQGQYETRSTIPALHALRWRLRFGNNTALNFPNVTDTTNSGAVRVHSLKVRTVKIGFM